MSAARSVQTNAALLVGLQVLNYLLPFLLIPILIRRLGLDVFGVWALAMALVSVLRTIVAYGFDLTAARDIAQRPDDSQQTGELLSSIVLTRLLLLAVPGMLLVIVAPASGLPGITAPLILLSIATLIGDAIAPVWLFHGRSDLPLANALRIASRIVLLVLTVLLVQGPGDLLLVPTLEAATSLLYGLVALLITASRYGVDAARVNVARIRRDLGAGLHVFLANASVHLYTTINGLLLGALLGPIAYAHYTVAEKIYSGVRGLIQAAVQAIFPRLAHLSAHDQLGYRRTALRLLGGYVAVCSTAAILLIGGAPLAVRIVVGAADPTAVACMRVFAVALLFATGGAFALLLIAQEQSRHLSAVTATTVFANLAALWPCVYWLGAPGAALAFLMSQVLQSLQYLWFSRAVMFERVDTR